MTETINYPRQEFEIWWKCTVCGSDFEYVGVRQEGASLRTHKDRPNFCPECGAEDTAWRQVRPINMAVEVRPINMAAEAVFPMPPEAARTVSMAMDAQLPETWADAKRTPYEDTPLTTREIEALLHVAPYNDGIERLAIQELLERRKADREALVALQKLGKDNVACARGAAALTYEEYIASKVLLAVVEGLLVQLEHVTKLATQLLEQTSPPLITTDAESKLWMAKAIAREEATRAHDAVTRSKKEEEA